ncbi:MAG TPA: flavodoxin family protein [Feifaniaceae bacterium]|nr:flavodoxin family protein [Feifaniaceae bacterium]
MKIVVLTGSPHAQGTTALLADEFSESAKSAGHEIARFDTAKLDIRPCIACSHCREHNGACVHGDDMRQIYPRLSAADAVVFVTPLYYFGMSAQLKKAVDRFYAINSALRGTPKKALLIAAGADTEEWAMAALKAHMENVCRYLNWQLSGMLFAFGAGSREDVEHSAYRAAARELWKIYRSARGRRRNGRIHKKPAPAVGAAGAGSRNKSAKTAFAFIYP